MPKTVTLRLDNNTYNIFKKAADEDKKTISNYIENAAINYTYNNNVVDDNEMAEIMFEKKDINRGLDDLKKERYKITE